MNVYDFDKTIYKGDSTLDFYVFCIKKQPLLILLLPIQILGFIKYKLGMITKLQFKETFYIFLKYVKNTDVKLIDFWIANKHRIQPWYIKQQKPDDLIISASPEFLLKPICNELGILYLIASVVDKDTGKCLSENCYGIEKTNRYYESYGDTIINEFYSDSLTDTPMAKMAQKSFGVKDKIHIPWNEFEMSNNHSSIKKEFILFIFVGIVNTINGVVFSSIFSLTLDGTLAFILGYAGSLTISYILNSTFVFKNTLSWVRFVKFCISYIPNFVIQFVMVFVFLHYFNLREIIVYTMSAILGVPITFLMVKFFALRK
ncbi:haloacid dehalogenase-like hydrolase [Lysinibacillus sp. fls2-241-R2A-57]|uniref:haloacid dehalogenase-like hydrolase n=1 Tax=Lysinibacillus sp. fls2-241-R2A-57 TaxID=3040292 RepID=UPI0025543022|nr:haloacid dehalogenase-like hydrolase [Lysinibacillus sp. fls2-241-R2A-57]